MKKQHIFQLGDFILWLAILGSVVAYQLCMKSQSAPLTTSLVTLELAAL